MNVHYHKLICNYVKCALQKIASLIFLIHILVLFWFTMVCLPYGLWFSLSGRTSWKIAGLCYSFLCIYVISVNIKTRASYYVWLLNSNPRPLSIHCQKQRVSNGKREPEPNSNHSCRYDNVEPRTWCEKNICIYHSHELQIHSNKINSFPRFSSIIN